jgi:lactate dehydrogenase-like 2-hydroxyacid dehydrogenase
MRGSSHTGSYATGMNESEGCFKRLSIFVVCLSVCGGWEFCNEFNGSPTNVAVLTAQEFARMQPGSILVQASAGTVLDKRSFLDWIGKDGNYALFDQSAGEDNYQTYKDLDRAIFADVVAGYAHETLERLYGKVIDRVKIYREKTGAHHEKTYSDRRK